MTAKEAREYQKEQRKLKDGEYAEEYKSSTIRISNEIKKDPSIEYVDIYKISKPVRDRLINDGYVVEYQSDGKMDQWYRISWGY